MNWSFARQRAIIQNERSPRGLTLNDSLKRRLWVPRPRHPLWLQITTLNDGRVVMSRDKSVLALAKKKNDFCWFG